jgi:signal transduction histidine kinase
MDKRSRPWVSLGLAVGGLATLFALLALVLYQRTERRVVEQHTHDHELLTRFAAQTLAHHAESLRYAADLLAVRLEGVPASWREREVAAANLPKQTRAFLLRRDATLWFGQPHPNPAGVAAAVEPWRGASTPVLTNPFPTGAATDREVALLVPLRGEDGRTDQLGLVLPLATLLSEPLRLGAEDSQPNLALLDEHGTVLVNTRHPEMLGRRVPAPGGSCQPCHSNFSLEQRMLAGESGAGQLQVGPEPLALVTFTPVTLVGRRWSLSLSQPYSAIVAETHRGFRGIVFLLGLILLVGLATVGVVSELRLRQQRAEERARLAEQQAGMERRLRQNEQLAALGRMSSQIAHQINTPLATLGLNALWLQTEVERRLGRRDLEIEEAGRAIAGEIERLQRAVNDYLRFARLPQTTRTRQSLRDAVEDYLAFLEPELRARKVKLEAHLEEDTAAVELDRALFGQAFGNLVRNALEAMPHGGRLRVSVERQGDDVLLQVEDNGTGIAPEALARIFEPFFTTKKDGTGLGLTHARLVVQEHGGTLDCVSSRGEGTTFTVRLPAVRSEIEIPDEPLLAGKGR